MHNNTKLAYITASALLVGSIQGFAPSSMNARSVSTELHFGLPNFGPKSDDDEPVGDGDKKIGAAGMIQLITAGLGAPFLGDFQGVEEESGKLMFSLEANNLVDENGESKQTSMPYFESGWVDPEDLAKAEKKKSEGGFKFPWQN